MAVIGEIDTFDVQSAVLSSGGRHTHTHAQPHAHRATHGRVPGEGVSE